MNNPFMPQNGTAARDVRVGSVVHLSGRTPAKVVGVSVEFYPGTTELAAVNLYLETGLVLNCSPGFRLSIVTGTEQPPALIPERTVEDYLARFGS